MLKISTTLFIVYSLLMAFMAVPALAQTAPVAETQATPAPAETADKKPGLKKLITDSNTEPAAFDPQKADAIHDKQQVKKGWSTQKKLWVTAAIIGAAGLLFVLIKYGKNCLRSSPAGCTPGTDEICTCEEYERRIPK
jgi:hypothetical protein